MSNSQLSVLNNRIQHAQKIEQINDAMVEFMKDLPVVDLMKLQSKEYCDKLYHHFNRHTFRTMDDSVFHPLYDILFQEQSSEANKCGNLARFYVRLIHLYSVIMLVFNHNLHDIYDDSSYDVITRLGIRASRNQLHAHDFCTENVQRLQSILKLSPSVQAGDMLPIPEDTYETVCSVTDTAQPIKGLNELEQLYYDTQFNYETKQFEAMSESSRQEYTDAVRRLYRSFTGNTVVPDTVQSFQDIRLSSPLRTSTVCSTLRDNQLQDSKVTPPTAALITKYGTHLNQMMDTILYYHKKLFSIMDKLFLYQGTMKIHPNITMEVLDQYMQETRNIVMDMYAYCEDQYVEGIKIYESILQQQTQHILEKQKDELLSMVANESKPSSE